MLDASEQSSDSGLAATFGGEMCVGSFAAGLGAPEVGWEGGFIPTLWWGVPHHPSRILFPCGVVLVTFSVTVSIGAAEGASLNMNRRA